MRTKSLAADPRDRTRQDAAASTPSPFPVRAMFILACCRICEPIAFMSIFPYIYYMIEDFHITEDPSKISVYAGMVTSAFALAEFATGFLWGRLSDKIGRKPVLLSGLAGTALSVLIFGLAPNLPVALLARALGGLLNGNIGVIQTTVAELVTVKEQQPRAYTIMPMVWCIGSIIGPVIGGSLARPCLSYPHLFPRGTIWDRFPYLLPNLFSAGCVCIGVTIGLLFLDETHALKKYQRDRPRELGRRLAAMVRTAGRCCACCPGSASEKPGRLLGNGTNRSYRTMHDPSPRRSVLDEDDDTLPVYQSCESSPKLLPKDNATISTAAMPEDGEAPMMAPRRRRTFTKPVIMNVISFGILAFHTIIFDQLLPVFLSTAPPEHGVVDLPFKFVDGFGLSTKTIGVIMAAQGIYSLFSNYLLVPPVTRWIGSLRLFRIVAFLYFPLYFITPYCVLLPKTLAMPAIYLLVIWKCTFSTLAYPNNAILLANAAPSRQVLGTINGVAASTASLCRALGPVLSGYLYSLGLQTGYSGLAWWFSGLTTIVGACLSTQITECRQDAEGGPSGRDDEGVEVAPLLDDDLLADYADDESV